MHVHYNRNLAAFFVLLVAASAGGVLPAAFMPDINSQNPTSPMCALVTDFNFIMGFSNNHYPGISCWSFPPFYLCGKVDLCQLFGAPVDPPVT